MPRKYIRKTTKPSIDKSDLVEAIKDVKIRKRTVYSTGRYYNIPIHNLYRYIHILDAEKIDTSKDEDLYDFIERHTKHGGSNSIFNRSQELALTEYVTSKTSKLSNELTITNLRMLAFEYASKLKIQYPENWNETKMASWDWYYGFMKRHPNFIAQPTKQEVILNDNDPVISSSERETLKEISPVQLLQPKQESGRDIILTSPEVKCQFKKQTEKPKLSKTIKTSPANELLPKKNFATKPAFKKERLSSSSSSSSSTSLDRDLCIICLNELPIKLDSENSVNCNTCRRALHLYCANISASFCDSEYSDED